MFMMLGITRNGQYDLYAETSYDDKNYHYYAGDLLDLTKASDGLKLFDVLKINGYISNLIPNLIYIMIQKILLPLNPK